MQPDFDEEVDALKTDKILKQIQRQRGKAKPDANHVSTFVTPQSLWIDVNADFCLTMTCVFLSLPLLSPPPPPFRRRLIRRPAEIMEIQKQREGKTLLLS